jgi:hypothetical protein
MTKKVKVLEVGQTLIDAFTSKCITTYAEGSGYKTFVATNLIQQKLLMEIKWLLKYL